MLWKRETPAFGNPWAVAVLSLVMALPLVPHACPGACSCPGPREVLCTFSHLASTPGGLPKDTQRLNLGYNSIQSLGVSEFTGVRRLEMLMLHGNDIQSVSPGAFYSLRSLRILKLSHNKLKTLTKSIFEGLSSLARLHLDHNKIEFIEPFSFSGLTSLILLNLEGNRLRDLHPHTFVTLSFLGNFWGSSLSYLHLSDNQLEYLLPGTLQHLKNLEALSLHGNPWACDCNLQWFLQWNNKNKGVIKCEKEGSGTRVNCAMCSSPQSLNKNQIFQLSASQLSCDGLILHSPLKLTESTIWQDTDFDIPYTKDLEPPLGLLTFMLSDSHGNVAYVDCVVKRQTEGTTMSWQNLRFPGQVALNVTLMSLLECEINRDDLQQLWRLVAYYYEGPAILERGRRQENSSRATFQYSQVFSEDSPYFTDLKGHLIAEPAWLLQPLVSLQLNRRKTTSKTLVLNFSTVISKQISSREEQGATKHTWALVERRAPGRIQTVLEGSYVALECKVSSSGQVSVEWMLPDLSILTTSHSRIVVSEKHKLVIDKASLSDSGLYHCLVRTKIDVDVVSFRLIVRERVLSPDRMNGKEMSVDSGGSLTLPCSTSSAEPSVMTWYLPTNIILLPSSQKGSFSMLLNGSLVIVNATQEDNGDYSCLAANLYGADMLSHKLVIREGLGAGGTSREPMRGASSEHDKRFEDKDEGQGSGYLEVGHLSFSLSPRVLGGRNGSRVALHEHSNKKRVSGRKDKPNKSVKILDFSHWAQNQVKGKSKFPIVLPTPQQTTAPYSHTTATSATTTVRTTVPTTSFSSGGDYVVTTSESVMIQTDLESAQMKTQLPVLHMTQKTPDTPKHQETTVYQGSRESNVFKASSVSPISVTVVYAKKVYAKQLQVGSGLEEEKGVQTPRRRPLYRRRRPFRRRIQPGRFFQNPLLSPPDKVKIAKGAVGRISTNAKESSESRDSFKPQVLEKSNIYAGNPELPRGSKIIDGTSEQYTMTSDAGLFTVTKKPIQIHFNPTLTTVRYLYKIDHSSTQTRPHPDVFSGATKHSLPMENNVNAALIINKLHNSKALGQDKKQLIINQGDPLAHFDNADRKSSWTAAMPTPQFHLSRVTRPPVPTGTESPSLTAVRTPLLINALLPAQHVSLPPALPRQSQARDYLQSKEEETLLKGSSSNSVTSGGYYRQVVGKLRDSLSNANKLKEDSLTPAPKSSKSFEVQGGSLQLYVLGKVVVPSTASTLSWAHPNQVHIWPSVESSQEHTSFPERSWHFRFPGGQGARVTVQPQITALPTNTSALTARLASPGGETPISHPPRSSPPSKIRDFALFSRLRNRYRQHKLDAYRLFQARKIVTHRPKSSFFNLRPQQATTSPQHKPAVTTASPVLATNQLHSTIRYDSRWHYSSWGRQKLNSALPSPRSIENGVKPKISSGNIGSLSALIETDVSLPCESSGEPRPALSWTKVSTGATIEANTKKGQRFEVLSNGTFVIKNVQPQDRGQYLCSAKNAHGTDQAVITLAVMTQPPRIVTPKSTEMAVPLGGPVNLDCVAEGRPQAQISWIFPDGTVAGGPGLPNTTTTTVFNNGTLRIEGANLSSEGKYKCIASSAAGTDTVTYHLDVVASSPTVSEYIALPLGSDAFFHCTAEEEPESTLWWTVPGGAKSKFSQYPGARISVFSNGTLFVGNISLTDSGRYECSAADEAGTTRRVVQLDVRQLPQQHGVAVTHGSNMYLHCPGPTSSQHGAVWRLPSKTLLDYRNSPEGSITAFPNGTLAIQQLTEKDGGSYLCMFLTSSGKDYKLFQVEVLTRPPKIERLALTHKRVAYGENFQIDCLASGFPAPDVSWTLPDGTIVDSALQQDGRESLPHRFVVFENGTLFLQNISKRDEGEYMCHALNKLGQDVMKVRISLLPDSPRILSKDLVSVWGLLGEPVRIKCQATGEPAPEITWFSPSNATITMSSIRYQILGDGTLIIRKVDLADRGNYACVARSLSGQDVKTVQLEVEGGAPRINRQGGRTSGKVSAVSHQTLLLDCKVEGLPEPHVTWTTSYGVSLLMPYLGGRFQVHRNGSLELRALRKTDEGQYVCRAQNTLGEAKLEIELEVKSLTEKPRFSMPNTEVVPFKPGSIEVTLGCSANGKPAPEFVWVLPNSTALISGTRLQRFQHFPGSGILRIFQPGSGDMGVYSCLANNVAGQARKQYVLEPGWKPRIKDKPIPMRIAFGQNVKLPCPVDAWPQATISWTIPSGHVLRRRQVVGRVAHLGNGTLELREAATFDRGTYTCKATNAFGSSTLSHTVVVTVYPPRIINTFPSVTVASRGSSARLSCRAVGIPKPDISWTLPGSITLTTSSPMTAPRGMHVTVEGSLVLQNPMLMNSGIYKCNARSAVGMDFKVTYLQVL